MNAATPIIIDGKSYPYYSINLAITTTYSNATEHGNAVLSLTPTRINEQGGTEVSPNNIVPVILGDMSNLSEPEKTAVEAIQTALQTYIIAKGL